VDVDLIAADRGMHPGQHPLLFRLLNEMDGLAEDADVVFVLTTNRADLLEPALFELYRGSLEVDTSDLDAVLEWTDGVTAAFLKELLRRAALPAAQRSQDGPLSVSTGTSGVPSTSCWTPATP
jgi:AAA+ superfamily predicted ATPase